VSAPDFIVIAGANGSGKTTLTKWARAFFQQVANLDPDAAAVDLQARTSGDVSPIEAGKRILALAQGYLNKGVSFSVETTLSGSTYLKMLSEAKRLGYHTRLFYVGTDDLSINVSRIEARVLAGGHDVPIEDQIRRYARSFENLPRGLELADDAVLLDNSSDVGHREVAVKLVGHGIVLHEPLPKWAAFLHS
jgi:predicted ABC-type ATPase